MQRRFELWRPVMSKTILVVEDNPLNMRLFCDLLTAHGFKPIPCDDGHSAFGIAERMRPDLIIMDIHLNGLSGIDVTKALRAHMATSHIPVIAVTAFVMESEAYMVSEVGFAAYLTKPIQMRPFIETVRGIIELNQSQVEGMPQTEDAA